MRRYRTKLQPNSRRNPEQGIVILLVAVFLLAVVGLMAALSIDVVTFYTARSEAKLAADGAALAGARVLANSGMTSNPTDANLVLSAKSRAISIATQVATQNEVGGRTLNASEVTVSFNDSNPTFGTNPHVTVVTRRNDIPTFFARWRVAQVTVQATATAEAYNPSGPSVGHTMTPVTPTCVKPWLLPNIDPTQASSAGAPIFDSLGAIVNPGLVGLGWPNAPVANPNLSGLRSRGVGFAPMPGRYYPGRIDAADFPAPTQALPACSAGFTPYQLAVAGCVARPIPCGAVPTSVIGVDTIPYVSNTGSRNGDTVEAVKCLIHYNGAVGDTDSIDTTTLPSPPFEFLAGNQNPIAGAVGKNVLVSDSLVTIPVYDSSAGPPGASVNVIGFLQVFLNPQSATMPLPSPPAPGFNQIPVTIINMAGCGIGASGQPILGNGASPVPVRLVSSQ